MQDWTPKELEGQIGAGAAVFLKLWKKGCGACKLSVPAIERLEADAALQAAGLVFGQINTDEHPEMLEISETGVLPAFFVFKDREMAGQLVGFKGLAKLEAMVRSALTGA